MKTRIGACLLVIVMIINLTGCWDYLEFDDFVQLFSMGIDYDKDSGLVTVTTQFLLTTGSTKAGTGASSGSIQATKGITHSARAETLQEAIGKLQQVTIKQFSPTYMEIFVVNEDAAKVMMSDILAYLDRNPLIRHTGYFLITQGTAKDTISAIDRSFATSSSLEILNLIKSAEKRGYAYPMTIHDFHEVIAERGGRQLCPE